LYNILKKLNFTNLFHSNFSMIFFLQMNSLAIVNDLSALLVERNPSDDIRQFVNETDVAEMRFHDHSEPVIRAIANDTLDNLDRYVSQYMNYSLHEVRNGVGRCRPASAAINATIEAVCTEVMRPFVRKKFQLNRQFLHPLYGCFFSEWILAEHRMVPHCSLAQHTVCHCFVVALSLTGRLPIGLQ
jgi:hypothetical protein